MGWERHFLKLAAGIAACDPSAVLADTTATFQVSATIVSGCEINGVLASGGETLGDYGTVDFGTHSSLSTGTVTAAITPNASLTLSCTPGVSLTMALDGGLHAATSRNMQAAESADLVPYRLYSNASLTDELLIGQASSVSFSDPQAITLPVYGKVILSGDKQPDTYSDTVILTLSW
jgi:spore coat protein U-like protein